MVGIISTLGGGFYAWGVFNNRLDELEQSTNTKTIKDVSKKVNILEKELKVLETKFEEILYVAYVDAVPSFVIVTIPLAVELETSSQL